MRPTAPAVSRLLLTANLLLIPPALIVYAFPNLILLGLFLLILPGLVMGLLPTLALYLVIFTVGWFAAIRFHWAIAFGTALAAVWSFAVVLPAALNRQALTELEEARPKDREPAARPAAPLKTIALEPPPGHPYRTCTDLCQVLLFNRQADRVILLPPPAEPDPQRNAAAPTQAFSYRIVPSESCFHEKDALPSGDTADWLSHDDARATRAAALARIAAGECLVREPAGRNPSADLTLRVIRTNTTYRSPSIALRPPPVTAEGLALIDSHDRVLAAHVRRTAALYATPLFLEARGSGGGDLGFRGWEWSRKRTPAPEPVPHRELLHRFTTLDLAPPGGASPAKVRAQLDRLLADPALPPSHAAFSLAEVFFRQLLDDSLLPGDTARLARLIADPRFTDFHRVPAELARQDELAPTLQDAMLLRLPELARYERRGPFQGLVRLAADLPEGAFRQPDPRLDALLADPALRPLSAPIILRLTDRGPAALPTLTRILSDAWSSREAAARQDDAADAAIRALCRLGPDARPARAQLEEWSARGIVPTGISESLNWRAMLVALGADPAAFPPTGRNPKPEEYRRRLTEYANRRCGLR